MSLGPVLPFLFLCLAKVFNSTQAVCGDGETEAQHANAMHSGLLSLCSRPAELPAGQGQTMGQGSPRHPCASYLGRWGATSHPPSLCSVLLSQQPGISSARATSPKNRVFPLPNAMPMDGTTLLTLEQNHQQFGRGWAKQELSVSCMAAGGMQIKALLSTTEINFISG